MFAVKYIVFFVCFIKNVSSDLYVQTSTGPIRGVSSLSDSVEAFLGIPFAEPPIGNLRFAKTVPKKQWTETLNASEISPPCPQMYIGDIYMAPNIDNMSEDCLYLNIWAPKPITNDTLKPIIIFLHSGAFQIGATNRHVYDGSNLARLGDMIIVTTNYRLGAFGFLLAYNEEANGNMGMHDQVMAIKWVKDNALAFGGDPENIVLMGEGAGGISVSMHMMSPISKSLFQKAIIHSGGAVHPYFNNNNTGVYANSESLASLTGCANDTVNLRTEPHIVIDCLKQQSVEAIITATKIICYSKGISFFPTVGDEFLPQSPTDLLSNRKFRTEIPVLTGINSDEGTLILTRGLHEHFGLYGESTSQRINKHFASLMARTALGLLNVSNGAEILTYYMKTIKNKTPIEYSKMIANIIGDHLVACSTIFQADFFSSLGVPVYFYMFAARSAESPFAEWMGTPRGEEVQYIFGIPFHGKFTNDDVKLNDYMVNRWSTFAKTGDPNIPGQVPWLQYKHKSPKYLKIKYEDEMIHTIPIERCKIWRARFKAVVD